MHNKRATNPKIFFEKVNATKKIPADSFSAGITVSLYFLVNLNTFPLSSSDILEM